MMSAIGTFRTCRDSLTMSAHGGKDGVIGRSQVVDI
jgi:hypothetical protein